MLTFDDLPGYNPDVVQLEFVQSNHLYAPCNCCGVIPTVVARKFNSPYVWCEQCYTWGFIPTERDSQCQ